jgi:hypothetical protein
VVLSTDFDPIPFSGAFYFMDILDPSRYAEIRPLVERIPFNTLFAQAILDKVVKGRVLVNSTVRPQTALIFHPYGMLLLCGQSDDAGFNQEIAEFMLKTCYPQAMWLQVYPPQWSTRLKQLLPNRLQAYPAGLPFGEAESRFKALNREKVVECTRVNLSFNRAIYARSLKPLPEAGIRICRMDQTLFEDISGVVIARRFWSSYSDFAAQGAGFCVLRGQVILSSCFTAFVQGNWFEIGIESNPQFRTRGYAALAARTFIDYCLQNQREPVWSCRQENVGSYKLALKLGFELVHQQPYYALVDNRR